MRQQRRTTGWMKRTVVAFGIVSGPLLLGTEGMAQNFSSDVTVTTGNAPTVIFNQDNTQTLGVQNWSLTGDETGVYLDDNTGGQTPFTIFKGAPDNSVVVASNGRVGLGTAAPEGNLHINGGSTQDVFNGIGPDPFGDSGTGAFNFGYSGFSFGLGSGFFNVRPASGSIAPNPSLRFATQNLQRMIIDRNGNVGIGQFGAVAGTNPGTSPLAKLHVQGAVRADGGFFSTDTTINPPDYVFAPDYPLRPLSELAAYIEKERHLPEIPSADTIKQQGLNLSQFQMQLLKKIEELTLYTLAQEKMNRAQAETIAHYQQTIGALHMELRATADTLTKRLQTLEQQQAVPDLNGQQP
jgi:hypothetical protein